MDRVIKLKDVSDSKLRDLEKLLLDSWGSYESYAIRRGIHQALEGESCAICGERLKEDKRKNSRKTCSDRCRKKLSRKQQRE